MNENKKFINIAVLAAVAVVLNLITIPLPFFASYLKIDISVVFLFIVGYRYGFKYATFSVVVVAIINSILKGSTPFFIGEITYAISFLIYFISYTAIKKTNLNNYMLMSSKNYELMTN